MLPQRLLPLTTRLLPQCNLFLAKGNHAAVKGS
jgi:hypothetical protein